MEKKYVDAGPALRGQNEFIKFVEIVVLSAVIAAYLPVAIVAIFGTWRNTLTSPELSKVLFGFFLLHAVIITGCRYPWIATGIFTIFWTGIYTYTNFAMGKGTGLWWLWVYITPCFAILFEGWLINIASRYLDFSWIEDKRKQNAHLNP